MTLTNPCSYGTDDIYGERVSLWAFFLDFNKRKVAFKSLNYVALHRMIEFQK